MTTLSRWEVNLAVSSLKQSIEYKQNNMRQLVEAGHDGGLLKLLQMQIEADTALVGKLEAIVNSDCKRIALK